MLTETMKLLRFGAKLDLLRRGQGLTVGEFAAKCGVPERTMDRLCAGENAPKARSLFLIVTKGRISLSAFDADDFEEEGLP